MTDLRQALRTAVAIPPPDEIDLVAVMASGRRARGRRRSWLTTAIATAAATAVIAGFAAVAVITRDEGDRGAPEPANPDRTHRTDRTDRAIDPVAPPRNFAADPVLGFEPDAPLLREGDVILGESPVFTSAHFTEDLQVLTSRRHGNGDQFGLFDPADPADVDWLPVYPAYADDLLPLCGYLVGPRGDCVQGTRTLWFYVWVEPSDGIDDEIKILRFDRLTREWSEAPRPPRSTEPDPLVSARVVDNRQLVIEGPAGRHVVPLDREPICDRRKDLVLWQDWGYEEGPSVHVEGEFVVLDYQCSVLFDPGTGEYGMAVYDARGRLLMHPPDEGDSDDYRVVDNRFVVYNGMLVDFGAGQAYRLLRHEPHDVGELGWQSANAWVSSVRAGLVLWWEHQNPRTNFEVTLHMTPLPGG